VINNLHPIYIDTILNYLYAITVKLFFKINNLQPIYINTTLIYIMQNIYQFCLQNSKRTELVIKYPRDDSS